MTKQLVEKYVFFCCFLLVERKQLAFGKRKKIVYYYKHYKIMRRCRTFLRKYDIIELARRRRTFFIYGFIRWRRMNLFNQFVQSCLADCDLY